MALVLGGAPKGVNLIAARWAETRNVAQLAFKPDGKRNGKTRAGFVRSVHMSDRLPIGVLAFPGTGVTGNPMNETSDLGIPGKTDTERHTAPLARSGGTIFAPAGMQMQSSDWARPRPILFTSSPHPCPNLVRTYGPTRRNIAPS